MSSIVIVVIQPDGMFDPTGKERRKRDLGMMLFFSHHQYVDHRGHLYLAPLHKNQFKCRAAATVGFTGANAHLYVSDVLHSATPFLFILLFLFKKHFKAEFSVPVTRTLMFCLVLAGLCCLVYEPHPDPEICSSVSGAKKLHWDL